MESPSRSRSRTPRTPPTNGFWKRHAARKEEERLKRENDAMYFNDPREIEGWLRQRETWAMQREDDFFLLYPDARDLD